MTKRDGDIFALLLDPNLHLEESEPSDEASSRSDPDISAILLESINKAQETSKFEFTPEDIAFVDSCLAFNSDDDWEFMKISFFEALNTPNSGSLKSHDLDLDLDEDMLLEKENNGENAEEVVESREDIFGIWNLDLEEGLDEIGLITDLEKLLSSTTGTAEGEGSNLELGEETENIEDLVADLGNLTLNPVEGWNDKIF